MVTLINKSGRLKTYNLDHPFFRTRKWGARRMNVTVLEHRPDGTRMPRVLKRTFPGSITLRAGEERKGLPDQIQAVAPIRKDIKAGLLRVVREPEPKAAPKATAPAAEAKEKAPAIESKAQTGSTSKPKRRK